MNSKMKIKIIVDLLLTILLLLLMAFQITGQEFHEWFGAGMLALFLVHNILNFKWYRGLCKGKYNITRVLQITINFAVLVSMLCLAYSGIVMSHYVFDSISISGQMALARQMHIAASYWGFVLMSVYLGFHWCMVVGMAGRLARDRNIRKSISSPFWRRMTCVENRFTCSVPTEREVWQAVSGIFQQRYRMQTFQMMFLMFMRKMRHPREMRLRNG